MSRCNFWCPEVRQADIQLLLRIVNKISKCCRSRSVTSNDLERRLKTVPQAQIFGNASYTRPVEIIYAPNMPGQFSRKICKKIARWCFLFTNNGADGAGLWCSLICHVVARYSHAHGHCRGMCWSRKCAALTADAKHVTWWGHWPVSISGRGDDDNCAPPPLQRLPSLVASCTATATPCVVMTFLRSSKTVTSALFLLVLRCAWFVSRKSLTY